MKQRRLTYKEIQAMSPETMTHEDAQAVKEWTARTNKQTAKILWVAYGLMAIALLLQIVRIAG